jgi:hypothetical protein
MISLLLCMLVLPAAAQDMYVPPELEPWRNWVLHGHEYRACPFVFNRHAAEPGDYLCGWPGLLTVNVTSTGGTFMQPWTVYGDEQWLALPGDAGHWPEAVQVDNRPALVVLREGSPAVRLGPGRYTVSGSFRWEERPQTLTIPQQSGLLSLTVDGRRITRPDRGDKGVWLGERGQQKAEQDAVEVQVYRLLADDVPSRLTTVLVIDVSGSVREELFGPALPEGWVPLAIDSGLPARLEPDGSIRLQLRPGRWNLRLQARAGDVVNEAAMPTPRGNLPDSEIWSYQSNDRLRVTSVDGANPVDPAQVNVPGEWRQLPAFRLQAGDALTLSERSRGKVAADNRLELERQLWLDFAGRGFVYADVVSGDMRSGWRLDMAEPYALLSATESGENLLITRSPDGAAGVELRQTAVDLEALGRLESRGELAVAGWLSRFEDLSIELNLPPGHRLFAAPGVDSAPGSWVSQWKLLDFFLVLIVTIATGRLFGNAAAAIALLALVLSLHEPGSAAWSWLNLLAAVALARVAPEGRLSSAARVYRAVSALLLFAILVPFLVGQIRDAIYPQLERRASAYADYGVVGVSRDAEYPATAPTAVTDEFVQKESRVSQGLSSLEEIVVTGSRITQPYARYADNAIVQAGPGRPAWEWNSYRLEFSGPVDAGRSMRLVIIPDGFLSLLRVLLVLAVSAFAAVFVFEGLGRQPDWKLPLRIRGVAASAGLACALLFGSGQETRAETPPAQILKELEDRLLAPPDCAPRCAEIVSAEVQIEPDAMSVDLSVHAIESVALPLPGSMNGWRPESVSVGGTADAPVYRGEDGGLWVQVRAGQTSVRLRGPLPPVASLEVPFPAPPRAITMRSDGWLVAGIRDRRLLGGSLQLTRQQQQSEEGGETWEMSRLPAFVRIERFVELDIDWRVTTTVFRIAPQQGAITLEVPLLEGEAIISADLRVTDGRVQVAMGAGARSVSWVSTLPRKSPLQLRVEDNVPWSELWRFAVGSVWHAEFDGVPESEAGSGDASVRVAEFYPRGGESLTVHAERPEGIAGNTLAFDSVLLKTTLGARTHDSSLVLEYRSTRGAQHVLRLPEDAQIVSVLINGRTEPLRASNGELSIPILPGEHSIAVDWQTDSAIAILERTPAVDAGAAAGNIALGMVVPQNRWILFTAGPDLGPAVLYWSEIAALILVGLILGRIGLTPLRSWHWILLGLGFSTFSWGAFAIVALWLLSSGARHRWRFTQASRYFNLLQVSFALLTIAALAAIVTSLPAGLLGTPDMHVAGYQSYGNSLHWFADRSESVLPQASVLTAPLWIYKALILVWALWLSFALLKWLPWVWQAFVQEGLWRPNRRHGKPGAAADAQR